MRRGMLFSLALVCVGAACAPVPGSGSSGPAPAPAQQGRTLVAGIGAEPKTLAARLLQNAVSLHSRRIFNADLVLRDDQSSPLPYLAEALPQLKTDSWKVLPDGRMETTYRLRPNLVWHDGTPLTGDAFVFSRQVFGTRDIGQSTSPPFNLIGNIDTPDDRTILIHWNAPYAEAGSLQSLGSSAATGLPPLPRHVLEASLAAGVEPFLNHPYWTNEYMGLGPYKLERWEPGAFIEASAFDRHALGAPKIQRVKLLFIPDDNGAMANLLSGEIDLFDNLPITQTAILMRQWAAGSGTVVPYSNAWTAPYFQWRPDMVNPPALHDRRVRAALAHTLDRASLNEAAFEGQAPIADSPFADNTELGRAANEGAVRYPFDPDRSAQLMAEAGFRKGADGFYVGPTGERFTPDLRGGAGSASERLTTAVASGWRQAGFDFTQSLLSAAQSQDPEAKSTYPGLLISSRSGGEGMLNSMGTPQISGPANNWRGRAWEGYSNPEMDRELNLFSAALDPADRARSAREIVRIYTSDLFSLPFFFNVSPWVFAAAVKGPMLRPASSNPTWNIHEWELR